MLELQSDTAPALKVRRFGKNDEEVISTKNADDIALASDTYWGDQKPDLAFCLAAVEA